MASRTPLGDATGRIINASSDRPHKASRCRAPERNPLRAPSSNSKSARHAAPKIQEPIHRDAATNSRAPAASRTKALANEDAAATKRDSQVSNSSASSGKRKTHIGPWQLGKTLGKGSAARVRLARHHVTHELAAVKILSQASCHMTQPGSLAELDQWDRQREEYQTENHIPLSIEREVAILKLIDHPNIMKLYDIWENRSEIYLVLEFVERGDLFEYINSHGPIAEHETVFYFRQMLSALEYCHSFNICHRDLKPENILLKENGQIKIADFGMAAIQQGPNHMLRTSCGSPHYAAPELVSRRKYRGDKVDIWSLGVILYAMLCARLPFDDPDIPRLLAKATKGIYEMPGWLSHNAQDLIRKMLQVDPKDRISTRKIWKHPLVVKYADFDRFDENGGQINNIPQSRQCHPISPKDVDFQTLRQLKSMWHTFPERELFLKLVSPEPNDQKLFYWLLYNYREKQLENYDSALTYSTSDFHHLRPRAWKTKYTTLEFPSQGGRTPSRFTVISNVATDPANETIETVTDGGGTIHSYDPYKSERVFDHEPVASHAKITVYRNASAAKSATKATQPPGTLRTESKRTASVQSRSNRTGNAMSSHGKSASRRSLASIRSTDSATFKRSATVRHKRGVDFSHVRRKSAIQSEANQSTGDETIFTAGAAARAVSISAVHPEKIMNRPAAGITNVKAKARAVPEDDATIWKDELRKISSSIAKDCDDAFSSSLLLPQPSASTFVNSRDNSGKLGAGKSSMARESGSPQPWETRPLPPAPPSKHGSLLDAERAINVLRKQKEAVSLPLKATRHSDNGGDNTSSARRRVVSAPIYAQYSTQHGLNNLDPIKEGSKEDGPTEDTDKHRIVSAPGDYSTPHKDRRGLEYLAQHENTIRLVNSPSAKMGQSQASKPLRVPKKLSRGVDTPTRTTAEEPRPAATEDEPSFASQDSSTASKKRSLWFKRISRDSSLDAPAAKLGNEKGATIIRVDSASSSGAHNAASKKKGFNFAFWRNTRDEPATRFSVEDFDFDETPSPEPSQMFEHPAPLMSNKKAKEDSSARHIAPQQNWLARLFHVKPATRYLCFCISRRRARREIAVLLREWRKYGIRDVDVDKERNIVFARVGAKNYLNIKEVAFAAEVMTVIEHGKRSQLCIVRLTQERGAASSFHRVVDTMDTVFESRNLLVAEQRKTKMMVKTLNA
ncbi:uncharacterized protein B0I36DRAFT_420402 [Microdochium trichocladiopsis]|uniref:non-specific serine/threonine protein kinase n=1 Tax=Microdochium trichocladiopsis TaxID=1682393 RepID=A0A9P9BS65_9PEZI|nr:uncharacterized protein B0I36DRAFT_420402 [Microdochium trichocladiopsis]KAH7037585.1 hypothetical protein B0I36DRAFT_420402 [Microdochium trichocladiopsis]